MTDATRKPVIFLAFANDRDETVGYLRNLPDEARRLRDVLQPAVQAGLCEVVVRSNSTAHDIFKVFQDPKFRDHIAIFHYGGHANGYQLLLESREGKGAAADAGGLAAFFAQQRGLQLVFLNGCSTQPQTQELLDANISMVISTSRSIDDKVATDFAFHFYQGLAGTASIRSAFEEAAASVRTSKGGNTRALYIGDKDDPNSQLEADRWPWNLSVRAGSENTDGWNLPDAANNPLAGLPPLPKQNLPETPYKHLNWFTREEAEVFFGRGHQIRELYQCLTAGTEPIVLFYGQSGVGKSSLLAAGLLPRLEPVHEVQYLRRGTGGLLKTLQSELSSEADAVPLDTAWLAKEEQSGKPLIVFLDQVEECYTRPLADMPDELDQLLQVLQATFRDIDHRPKGKLILGFREEWLAKLEARVGDYRLPRTKVFLKPLDHRGIMEVVRGPTRSERLRERYALTVDEGLAEMIADDLLADRGSAISTTLQILLSKMWAEATEGNSEPPQFSRNLYRDLKGKGILLSDFLDQQLQEFHSRLPDAADSGLLLDVLAVHTTALGTASQSSREQLLEQYAHVSDVLPSLLQHCQDLYLLTEPVSTQKESTKTTRLAHDTLAPLVRDKFDKSDRPGQRARRILDNRSVDWKNDKTGTPLDEADLKLVEQGIRGTRTLNATEQRLVQASRDLRAERRRSREAAEQQRREMQQALKTERDKLLLANEDLKKQTEIAQHNLAVNDLSNASFAIREQRMTDALHWYLRASDHAPIGDRLAQSARSLLGAWSRSHPSTLQHDGAVCAVAFSPDGQTVITGSRDMTARLWDAHTGLPLGEPLRHDGPVTAVAFSPDGQTVITGGEVYAAQLWVARTGQALGEPLKHKSFVLELAFSSDGLTVVTGSEDKRARLWDARTGQPLGKPLKHRGSVRAVAFSPDGLTVLTGSADKKAQLWDARTGQRVSKPLRHDGVVMAVAFSPDGQKLITGSLDEKARLWDARTGQRLGKSLKHDGFVRAVAFSPDGLTVLTGSVDKTARLWDACTGKVRGAPLKHDGMVVAVAFSPDGLMALTGSADNAARLWDVSTGALRGEPRMHDGEVGAVAFSPDGLTMSTGSNDNKARLWDVCARQARAKLKHDGEVDAVAFSPDGQRVLTGSWDKTAQLWDARTGQPQGEPLKHDDWVCAVAFSPDGQTVLTGSDDYTARLWNASTGRARCDTLRHERQIRAAMFSADGQTVLTGSDDKTARMWSAHTGQTRGGPLKHDGPVTAVAFSPDGQMVLSGSEDRTARLWDARTRQPRFAPLKHGDFVTAVAFSPDCQTVLTGSADNMARLWDVCTGQPRGEALKHGRVVRAIAFSPDGQMVLSGSEDETARLWDARTGLALGAPLKHDGKVHAVAFSPDGLTVLTGSEDGTARLWDARTGLALGAPLKHDGKVHAVAFSPDGQTVLTGSEDGTARLWDVPPPAADAPEPLRLSVQVRTGSEFDENSGTIERLTQAEWLERQERLWKEFGGPWDVRTWDQVREAEKQQLRQPK